MQIFRALLENNASFYGAQMSLLISLISVLLSLVPGTNETLTRLPPSHPLADAPLSPLVLQVLQVWLGLFVLGFAAQCWRIHVGNTRRAP